MNETSTDMSALGVIRAMIAEYVRRDRVYSQSINGRDGQARMNQAGFADAIVHAVSVAYGESIEQATERAGDMIADVIEGMAD